MLHRKAFAVLRPSFHFILPVLIMSSISNVSTMSTPKGYIRVPIADLRHNTMLALERMGHPTVDSQIIADTLMYAELRANNQGLIKLITGGLPNAPDAVPISKVFESPVSAKLDGGRRIGMVVVNDAVELAITKAREHGIGIVGCSNYNTATGALGYWAQRITAQGMIGIVMSQCSEMVAPHGSYEAIFGTNPIAIGVPTLPRAQVLDMATSSWAWYALKTAEKEGKSIPDDVAYDEAGNATTDPAAALRGALRVFDRSFKGSHLALMVELLAGALTGADMQNKRDAAASWGSLVLAIHPSVMGPENDFQQRAQAMCERVKLAKPLPGQQSPLLLPGERGDAVCTENTLLGTVPIPEHVYLELQKLAQESSGSSSSSGSS